jgi:two-component system chemotaxis response regulator CheY
LKFSKICIIIVKNNYGEKNMNDEKITVLAVDDSSFMLSMITAFLENSHFKLVGTAKDGNEALQKYKELKPNIVLLDIVMPGESGTETLSRILEFDPNACVVMVSSLGTEDAVIECLKKGAKNFVQKPFEPDGLIAVLENVMKSK